MVEYAAIIILVAAIATAVYQLGLAGRISDGIGGAIMGVLQGSPDAPLVQPAETTP
ncbi:hypothetical protein [Nocardiopsis sp. CNR-923]|uniref:hypothetical protein n=1 Tax=Nocardiopsis sp. CNR-923 TaxID=1904965 RepID=UPI0013017657|nr:hypothetical protein [Nocardiopsis sp. CNR-923]